MPMREGVNFVHNALVGINARDRIRIGAAGKIATAFDMARAMAIGADWCNSARGFMFSLGCIQSLSCHTDRCPTGVTTQDPSRNRALVVPHKIERVYNYHHATLHALAELLAAAGLEHPQQIRPIHFSQRTSTTEVQHIRAALSVASTGRTDRRHQRSALSRCLGDGAGGLVPGGGVGTSVIPGCAIGESGDQKLLRADSGFALRAPRNDVRIRRAGGPRRCETGPRSAL